MNNEEYAAAAYAGNNEALGQLYMNCYKFICKAANSYYALHRERLHACGIQFDDMLSEAYFALPEAIKAFNEQETEYKFMTFLTYPLINCFNRLAGKRTKHQKKEPLNAYLSLDAPISDADDLTFGDTVEDKNTPSEDEITENIALSEVFPTARKVLSDIEYEIIEQKYKHNLTHKDIAQHRGCSTNNITTHQNNALRKLRRTKRMQELSTDIIDGTYSRGGAGRFKNTGTSSTEWAVLQMETMELLKSCRNMFDELHTGQG